MGTAAGLRLVCGVIDILKGHRRHPTKETDKFLDQCTYVGFGLSAIAAVGGGIGLARSEFEEEPTFGQWVLVSIPIGIVVGLAGAIILVPDPPMEPAIDSIEVSPSAEGGYEAEVEEEAPDSFDVDCTGKEIQVRHGSEKAITLRSRLPSTCDAEVIVRKDGGKTLWIMEEDWQNPRRSSNILLGIVDEEIRVLWEGRGKAEVDAEGRWWKESLTCLLGKAQMVITRTQRTWEGAAVEGTSTTRIQLIDLDLCLESPMGS